MTVMTTHGTGMSSPNALGHRQVLALRRLLRRTRRAVTAGAMGLGASLPSVSPAVDRELHAIHTFARHLVKHPAMPREHRARYLGEICRSCEEVLEELS